MLIYLLLQVHTVLHVAYGDSGLSNHGLMAKLRGCVTKLFSNQVSPTEQSEQTKKENVSYLEKLRIPLDSYKL